MNDNNDNEKVAIPTPDPNWYKNLPDSMFEISNKAVEQLMEDLKNQPESSIAIKSNNLHKFDPPVGTLKPINVNDEIVNRCQEAYDERDNAKRETRMYKRECERLKQQVRELTLERNNANQELALYKKRYFEVLEKLESKN